MADVSADLGSFGFCISSLHGRLWADSDCSSFPPLSPQTHCGSQGTHTFPTLHTHCTRFCFKEGGSETALLSCLSQTIPSPSVFLLGRLSSENVTVSVKFGGRFLKKLGSIHWVSMRSTAFPQRVCMLAADPRGTRFLEGMKASSLVCLALDCRDRLDSNLRL